jgi:hypothetical protein
LSKSESWKTWVIVIAILVIFGLASALWPALTDTQLFELPEPKTRVPVETAPIVVELPDFLGGARSYEPIELVGILTGIVVGAVVVVGGGIGFVYVLANRFTSNVFESKEYKENQAALAQQQKEYLMQMRGERKAMPKPEEHGMPRWSVVSTSLTILIFVAIGGMIIVRSIFPEGTVEINGGVINPNTPVVGGLSLITLLVILWRLRPQKLANISQTDDAAVPWDFIAVLILGLLIVGLGIAAMVYLNVPA